MARIGAGLEEADLTEYEAKQSMTGRPGFMSFASTSILIPWTSQTRLNRRPIATPDASLIVALRKQLGLQLEPGKGPREFLRIDRLERPSEN